MRNDIYLNKKFSIFDFLFKFMLFTLILLIVVSHITSGTLAKYKSDTMGSDSARVADFGELYFYEYTVDGNKLASGTETLVETVVIEAGKNVGKNVNLSYSGNEVLVYTFFVVNADGWNFENEEHRFVVKNTGDDDVMEWKLDEAWTYLEDVSSDNQFVFYHEVLPNVDFDNNIMTEIEVNSIGIDDVNLLKSGDYSLEFKAYAVSALDVDPIDAWNNILNR